MKELLLFKRTVGLNVKRDPARLIYDAETGVVELSEANNILVDDSGRPGRRPGQTEVESGDFHSIFCDGGDCYVGRNRTSDAVIEKLETDETITTVHTGLTKGARISFCQVNDETYYSNGYENGYLKDGTRYAWPVQSYQGSETRRNLTAPPVGKHLAFHRGRMVIAESNALWFTELFQFGLLDREQFIVQTMSDIRMVAPVKAGVFVSDANRMYFFSGGSPVDFTEDIVSSYPAHEYSLAHDRIEVMDIGMELRGLARMWSSTQGTCLGLPDGTLLNLTNKKIEYENTNTKGASLVWEGSFGFQGIANTY